MVGVLSGDSTLLPVIHDIITSKKDKTNNTFNTFTEQWWQQASHVAPGLAMWVSQWTTLFSLNHSTIRWIVTKCGLILIYVMVVTSHFRPCWTHNPNGVFPQKENISWGVIICFYLFLMPKCIRRCKWHDWQINANHANDTTGILALTYCVLFVANLWKMQYSKAICLFWVNTHLC